MARNSQTEGRSVCYGNGQIMTQEIQSLEVPESVKVMTELMEKAREDLYKAVGIPKELMGEGKDLL